MNKKLCQICGDGYLTDKIVFDEFDIPLEYSVCDGCGSEQASSEQTKRNKQIFIELTQVNRCHMA